MNIQLKHIGLQVIEKDITPFYNDLFDYKISRTFDLSSETANEIFGINKSVQILYGSCGELDLELFVSDNISIPTFSHTCICVNDAQKIIEKARQNQYPIFIRDKNKGETFFIQDSNFNIFEVKNIV